MRILGFNIKLTRAEKRSSLKDPDEKIRQALGGPPLLSGVTMNEETAMSVSAVYSCVRILSETVAQLPLRVMRRTANGMEEATDHPAFRLLKEEPNEWQSSFDWREMLQGHVALRGNAYALIQRNARFEPTALIPLDPRNVEPLGVYRNGLLNGVVYRYQGRTYNNFEMVHLRGLTTDGIKGFSPVSMLRETMGLPKAMEASTAAMMGNGVRPTGVLEHPGQLSDQALNRLSKQVGEQFGGTSNTGKTLVLEEDMKWRQVGMTFEDAQMLETKKFSIEEIARVYRIPLFMLQSTEKSTSWGTGIEQMMIGFVMFTMQPWLVRWEQTLKRVLISEDQKNDHFVKYDLRGLLRGDHKTRMDAYAVALLNGIYSINEVRSWEELNELPDHIGGIHRVPSNTVEAGKEPESNEDPQKVEAKENEA